jgi:hypothetical protein
MSFGSSDVNIGYQLSTASLNMTEIGLRHRPTKWSFEMAETVTLIDHEDVRDWAAARMGSPAIVDTSPEGGVQPMLMIVFDQVAYEDRDLPDRPPNAGGYDLVEWSEWLSLFDRAGLALVVGKDVEGRKDSSYTLVPRE